MYRRMSGLVLSLTMCMGVTAAWASDDPTTNASLRAELDMLKRKMERIESQLNGQPVPLGSTSTVSTSDRLGLPTLQLPSGLAGLQLSGLVDTSYIFNFNTPSAGGGRTNRGRFYDNEPNGFTPHLFELDLEKQVSDEAPIGFRADLTLGDDVALTKSTGLGVAGEDVDLQQAYAVVRIPIGSGLDVKAGKFVTTIGAEVAESPANWNFSRSFLFSYAEPATHTGVLLSYPVTDMLAVNGGLVNGWDIVDDNNKGKSLLTGITVTPMTGVSLIGNLITGPEQACNSKDDRTLLDFVASWQATEQLAFMANYDFGHEGAGPATGFDSKEWQGLALYAKYDISPVWALAGRWEWFDDKANFRSALTGRDGSAPSGIDFFGYTLTSQWKLYEHVLARLEYRRDQAGEQVFFRNSGDFTDHQDTVSAELAYHF